ncbi:pilus assembly PilX N-terminal domain-containing protein [Shewanella olleyana]|uniref:pilus assembly PilX family protein n=1 Tax=Shewanella olleyana TaxID=135626 RepID=UPI00200EB841|nr:pilus assembly PilX N-terminal domain-containing protein [Shewanella olleyana]MCL1067549.1 pilus assembly PilX N-terminal domain-containing protein [Shewanella olleyana]
MKSSFKKQQGIVLFFSLIVLVVMTIIGVGLAVNSSQSLRMAGAGSDSVAARLAAIGAQSLALENNKGVVMANIAEPLNIAHVNFNVNSVISPLTIQDVNCQRTSKAYAADTVSCRRSEISSTATFGRGNLGSLTVVTGVEQEVFTGS